MNNGQYNNQLEFLDIVTVLSFAFQLKTQEENTMLLKEILSILKEKENV
jgi:hypothetical protein|nr:MAG TPA: hypothetical protein [Caudoviricetes sp.]